MAEIKRIAFDAPIKDRIKFICDNSHLIKTAWKMQNCVQNMKNAYGEGEFSRDYIPFIDRVIDAILEAKPEILKLIEDKRAALTDKLRRMPENQQILDDMDKLLPNADNFEAFFERLARRCETTLTDSLSYFITKFEKLCPELSEEVSEVVLNKLLKCEKANATLNMYLDIAKPPFVVMSAPLLEKYKLTGEAFEAFVGEPYTKKIWDRTTKRMIDKTVTVPNLDTVSPNAPRKYLRVVRYNKEDKKYTMPLYLEPRSLLTKFAITDTEDNKTYKKLLTFYTTMPPGLPEIINSDRDVDNSCLGSSMRYLRRIHDIMVINLWLIRDWIGLDRLGGGGNIEMRKQRLAEYNKANPGKIIPEKECMVKGDKKEIGSFVNMTHGKQKIGIIMDKYITEQCKKGCTQDQAERDFYNAYTMFSVGIPLYDGGDKMADQKPLSDIVDFTGAQLQKLLYLNCMRRIPNKCKLVQNEMGQRQMVECPDTNATPLKNIMCDELTLDNIGQIIKGSTLLCNSFIDASEMGIGPKNVGWSLKMYSTTISESEAIKTFRGNGTRADTTELLLQRASMINDINNIVITDDMKITTWINDAYEEEATMMMCE